jgi:nitrous oxide reductase
LGWNGEAVKKKISRREFLSSAIMLFFSAVAAAGGAKLNGRDSTGKTEIAKTSRKKADYYRELAG